MTTKTCDTCNATISIDHPPVQLGGIYRSTDSSTYRYEWISGRCKLVACGCAAHPVSRPTDAELAADSETYLDARDRETARQIGKE